MYVNHKSAKKTFHTLITTESPNWIIISGGEYSGKTSFIKEVCPAPHTLFCEPQLSIFYMEGFIPYILSEWQLCVEEYLSQSPVRFEKIKEKFDVNYINDIAHEKYNDVVRILIHMDIDENIFEYAEYLGNILCKNCMYIVLDNFNKCDLKSYEWLLRFSETYLAQKGYIIAVCDFETQWESDKIHTIFRGIPDLINIQLFDTTTDYFHVLNENIYFDNIEIARQLAEELFTLYSGDAQLLFKTIKIYEPGKDKNDAERQKRLLGIAHNLTLYSMKSLNKMEQLVLNLLSLSPAALSKNEISKLLEVDENIIQEILLCQYNRDLVEFEYRESSHQVCYHISDTLIQKFILHTVDSKTRKFVLHLLWGMTKSGVLHLPVLSQLDLSYQILDENSEELLFTALEKEILTEEKKIKYIDKLYSLNLNRTHKFSTYDYAKTAYEFGYFDTSLKMLLYMKDQKKSDYDFLMLLGGVQHLLLLPEAPETFEEAASLTDISVSQHLSAVNREIMSLNQAGPEAAMKARQLYDKTLKNYATKKCDGLIALYRNTNNSYSMDIALEYTIKGYQLAVELENELEQYKCIHNICMIRLHQGLYPAPLNRQDLDMEPTFEMVDSFFAKSPRFYHKRAYPLLDLGTYEMFEYMMTNERDHLIKAKDYYSKAQLFAKSFYARHIAEMSLLITNTHLYCKQTQMAGNLKQKREELFREYATENIVDFRVNCKILLSLSVSSVLTRDLEETRKYLGLAKPYISGPETARYDNLCILCENPDAVLTEENSKKNLYYASPRFVPWLISLAH